MSYHSTPRFLPQGRRRPPLQTKGLLLRFDLRPGVLQCDGAVEYRFAKRGILRIDEEITHALKLETLAWFCVAEIGFEFCVRENLQRVWVEESREVPALLIRIG